ncbi:MAG TPA: YsnF/AvaK domain-containing protein [Pyrinomonadaceae bacterium]|nr:YsnF/AvaK domain-containing protein [Pyrinomonadaceae bacterium]
MNSSQARNAYADDRQQTTEVENPQVIIPVIQEEVSVDKQVVETGKVRISKKISEREELVDEPLLREEVAVERVPINQYVDAAPQARQEGDTLIIPVMREEIVVQKRLVLVEELRVRKQIVEAHEPQSVTLLKEEVEITRTAADENPGGRKLRGKP